MKIGYVGKAFDRNDTVNLELNNKKMLEKYMALFDDYVYVKLKRMEMVGDHYETIDECDGRPIIRPMGPQRNPDIFRWEFVAEVGRNGPERG